ncbi:hypothetical protein F4778DRAFT_210839 [Xylariomycetidae sp. FL2044]|nr:hypothetical protein F4778DRAFT_210839 [Xylariomycetidae sp. FL2044]
MLHEDIVQKRNAIRDALLDYITRPGASISGRFESLNRELRAVMEMAPEQHRFDIVEAALEYAAIHLPNLCNPDREDGKQALERLVELLKFFTTKDFDTRSTHCGREDAVVTSFCRSNEYSWPLNGSSADDGEAVKSRYKFICFNMMAMRLYDTKPDLLRTYIAILNAAEAAGRVCVSGGDQYKNQECARMVVQWIYFSDPTPEDSASPTEDDCILYDHIVNRGAKEFLKNSKTLYAWAIMEELTRMDKDLTKMRTKMMNAAKSFEIQATAAAKDELSQELKRIEIFCRTELESRHCLTNRVRVRLEKFPTYVKDEYAWLFDRIDEILTEYQLIQTTLRDIEIARQRLRYRPSCLDNGVSQSDGGSFYTTQTAVSYESERGMPSQFESEDRPSQCSTLSASDEDAHSASEDDQGPWGSDYVPHAGRHHGAF